VTDGHAKNFSVFITPGGRFRLTPAYDVLTAQPSLDTGRTARKQFRLAMSVGKNRHCDIDGIMPRQFLQTADLAGVGVPAVRAIIGDLGEAAPRKATAVIEALPQDFPGQLVESVMTAINERSHLLAVFNADAVPR
jgi:serine/threonine-protein kinase HipA